MNSLADTEAITIDSSDDDDLEVTRYSRAAITSMYAWLPRILHFT
jgi:hypothetical protein